VLVDDQTTVHSAVPADTNDIKFDSPAEEMQALLQTFAKVRTAHFLSAAGWTLIDRVTATFC
jgi:hypothetical protein